MITLRQLRYLAALARHRHFGRAAEECAVTQPALSMQVRELERALGLDLVERRPGDVALSETGAEIARRAAHILTAVQDLVDYARHREVLSGALRLGIIPTLAPYLLPRLLPLLPTRHPRLHLEVRETQTRHLVDELARGDLDCLLLALPVEGADVESIPLFDDPFLLAVPSSDPLAARKRVTTGAVDPRRLVLLEEGHCLRDQALAFCNTARGSNMSAGVPAGLGAASLATVMQMVASGYGITLVPQVAIDVELRDDRVKLLRFAEPEPRRVVGLAFRRTSPRMQDFHALAALVREALGLHKTAGEIRRKKVPA
jgi:LysR family hydrogen peroxide-inducible transcriptional activator